MFHGTKRTYVVFINVNQLELKRKETFIKTSNLLQISLNLTPIYIKGKRKRSMNKWKRSKAKQQTTKKIFSFACHELTHAYSGNDWHAFIFLQITGNLSFSFRLTLCDSFFVNWQNKYHINVKIYSLEKFKIIYRYQKHQELNHFFCRY